jgi:WD40 repeat protein
VFSPVGDFFATGGSDSQVMVWKSNFDQVDRMYQEQHEGESMNLQLPNNPLPSSNDAPNGRPKSSHSTRATSPVHLGGMAKIQTDFGEPIQFSAPILSEVV